MINGFLLEKSKKLNLLNLTLKSVCMCKKEPGRV
jgi:hypothetical protein